MLENFFRAGTRKKEMILIAIIFVLFLHLIIPCFSNLNRISLLRFDAVIIFFVWWLCHTGLSFVPSKKSFPFFLAGASLILGSYFRSWTQSWVICQLTAWFSLHIAYSLRVDKNIRRVIGAVISTLGIIATLLCCFGVFMGHAFNKSSGFSGLYIYPAIIWGPFCIISFVRYVVDKSHSQDLAVEALKTEKD